MVTDFQSKLIIAGSVGGACAFFSSVLVFVILACRHQRKLQKLAKKRRNRRRVSTQSSAPVSGTSDLVRGLNGRMTSADLPLPLPADGNYIQPAWGVGHFWMEQKTLNHDSGFGELDSDRADSAVFLPRSISPLPQSMHGSGMQTIHGDTFPAMSHFDSPWSYSFDLSSPVQPYPCLGYARQNLHLPANLSNVTSPSSIPSGEDLWKSRKSCRSENNIQSSYQEFREPDGCLQLMELGLPPNQARPLHPGCHASVPSSSDNEDNDPVWVRRTSANMDSNLIRSVVDSNRTAALSPWQPCGNQSLLGTRAANRDFNLTRPATASCARVTSETIVHQKVSALGYKQRGVEKKQNGFCHQIKTHENIVYSSRNNSN